MKMMTELNAIELTNTTGGSDWGDFLGGFSWVLAAAAGAVTPLTVAAVVAGGLALYLD